MKLAFGLVALMCVVGATLALIWRDLYAVALFAAGGWVTGGWFVAMVVSASAGLEDEKEDAR